MNTHTDADRTKLINIAGWIALGGNLVLAILKVVIGTVSGSLAVLGDGIDSATDVAIACMTLVIGRIITRPSDTDHPWGHGRAETTATMVVAFIIFYAGVQLVLSAARQLYGCVFGNASIEPVGSLALLVTAVSVVGKLFLSWSQFSLGKKAGSAMVLANAQNMRNDIVISASVLIGLGAAKICSVPAIDPLVALLVGLWVLKNAAKLFMQMNMELMDGNQDKALYETLFTAIRSVPGVSNPHRARIRKIASRWDIDIDIEVDAKLSVHAAHEIAERVEMAVRRAIPDVYDIMVHVEPAGHTLHHPHEEYGLSESDLKENK
ncbi:cation diffusion facilitator family transporter [Treponema brennaborense]|uniref:Cation diffusion facilitator family transporter n=1 Tax=Treponema brennaborense (strain DSM 12168 / CIP 105900 / DD5/3) TaxID=906968 RepID=F4LN93_TREBD|nr:cation diffusion facilitator family transporter [Treponema brennaborense]AEE16858.1 cation diffusion facilitator family transporter [Treponema brennaborense DSM 12168]